MCYTLAVKPPAPESDPPKRPISLRKNVMWTGLGNAVYLGCQYLVLMVLSKLGNPTLVGQYALALAITAPPIIFSQMQFRRMQVTDVKDEFAFADYLTSRLLLTILALTVILGITVWSGYSARTTLLILLVGIAKAFESMSDIAYGRMQKHERMRLIAISMTIKGIGSASAFGILLGVFHSLILAVGGMGAAWALLFLVYDLPNAKRMCERREPAFQLHWPVVRKLVVLALPLAIGAGLTSLSGNVPRYFMKSLCSVRDLGFFSVAAAPILLTAFLCQAITDASIARAARYYQEGNAKAFVSLAVRIACLQMLLAMAGAVAFALFGKRLVFVLFTPEYGPSVRAALIMMCGVAIGNLGAFGSLTLNSARMFTAQTVLYAAALVIQVPVAYLLTSRWKIVGASWGEFVKYCALMIGANVCAVKVLVSNRRAAAIGGDALPADGLGSGPGGVSDVRSVSSR